MFHADGSTLRVARYVMANTDEITMEYAKNDLVAAGDLGLTVRTYRDALRKLMKLGVIWRDEVKRGPAAPDEFRVRSCYVRLPHPFWSLAMATDELAGWSR